MSGSVGVVGGTESERTWRPRAVSLDALGTLLELEPPAPALRAQLAECFGLELPEPLPADALDAEIAHYRAHHDEGRDEASLAALQRDCARVLRDALGAPARELPLEELTAALLGALVFRAFPDAAPALAELRAAGVRLAVVSNWDVSLERRLAPVGLLELLDAVVPSAAVGACKPDPAPFRRALELLGVDGRDTLHVGDQLETDAAGAHAAGIPALLLVRGERPTPVGVPAIRSLAELPALVVGP